jgi:hypothetical protein
VVVDPDAHPLLEGRGCPVRDDPVLTGLPLAAPLTDPAVPDPLLVGVLLGACLC